MSEKKNTPPHKQNPGKSPANNQPAASPSPASAPASKSPDNKPEPQAAPKKPETSPAANPAQKPADKPQTPAPQASTAPKADTVKPADSKAETKTGTPDKAASAAPAKPATPPPVQRAPATQENSKGRGLSLLALAISAVALALGGYQFMQNAALKSQLQDQRSATHKEISRLDAADSTTGEQITALRNDIANIQMPAPGMDRDSVVKTLAESSAKLEKSIAEAKTAALGEMEKRLAAIPQGLKREDVQSQIKQALATFAQGSQPTLDFSDEIAKVQASESSAKNILAQIEQQAAQVDSRLQQALADAEKQLAKLADSRASTLNLVTLAQLAGHAGQYQAAAQYLQQAAALVVNSEHARLQSDLANAAQRFQQLSSLPSPHASIDQLIARVGEWPIRNSGTTNLIAPDAAAAPKTLMDKVKHVGHEIIAHTVTVVPLDDEGLSWINHNPALQNIIRENVRLDLAFARNALQLQDSAAYTRIAATLKGEIERYFDADSPEIRGALDTLAKLESAQHALPDLAPVIQALRNGQ